jgi:hypothetical protein
MEDEILGIMFDKIDQYGLTDIREELINVLTAAVYRNASGYARKQIIDLWNKVEKAVAEQIEPPTEEQLSLAHPEMLDI